MSIFTLERSRYIMCEASEFKRHMAKHHLSALIVDGEVINIDYSGSHNGHLGGNDNPLFFFDENTERGFTFEFQRLAYDAVSCLFYALVSDWSRRVYRIQVSPNESHRWHITLLDHSNEVVLETNSKLLWKNFG